MPDFFTRLAERTLGLANTIQPVLPSLFAPGAPVIDTGVDAEQGLTIEDSAPQPPQADRVGPRSIAEHVEQHTPAPPHHDRQSTPRSVVRQPDQPPTPTIERIVSDQPRLDSVPDAGQQSAMPPAETTQQIDRHPESAQQIMRKPAPATPADPQRFEPTIRHTEHPRLIGEPEPAPSTRSSEQRPTIERQTVASEPTSQRLATNERGDPASPGRATLLPLTEQQVPHSQRREATTSTERPELVLREQNPPPTPRTPEPSVAQPGPQIHVSIGRIEVRAVTPPPAPVSKPTPAPTPRMSLDDYLRSQNGDRR